MKKRSFIFLFIAAVISSHFLISACNCPAPPPGCPVQPDTPCLVPLLNIYKLRYSTVGVKGAITFIGNTLGLSKEDCLNEPGTNDANGTFTTTNPALSVGTFPSVPAMSTGGPAGTTLDWHLNGSTAVLDTTNFPPGSTILYAELVWSGSYGYYCSDPTAGDPIGVSPLCILAPADGPITFTTADGVPHAIFADPATAQNSQNPAGDVQPFMCGGNYVRSANVTALFSAPSLTNPRGTYTVSGVPATVSPYDETHNAAGWTLAIVYQNPATAGVNNISFFVAAQQASNNVELSAEVTGFCTPPEGPQSARILISAVEGDAGPGKTGDTFRFAQTVADLALAASRLSGPNNIIDNFFASQINDNSGNVITTTGTFCNVNQDPALRNIPGARQGYDITNVDGSTHLVNNQTTAFARATTSGDDYTVNALGIQINVLAPTIVPIKKVNGQDGINADVGETVTFTIVIDNDGTGDANNVVFKDIFETGLVYVPGTFKINNVATPDPDFVAGIPLGTINASMMVTLEYQVNITAFPLVGNIYHNFGTASFDFTACQEPITTANNSNIVTIVMPNPTPNEPPSNFNGVIRACEFINKTKYSLAATWDPTPSPNVVEYRIIRNGEVVATIPAEGPFVFETCLRSKSDASSFSIIAVFPDNVVSLPLNIRITNE